MKSFNFITTLIHIVICRTRTHINLLCLNEFKGHPNTRGERQFKIFKERTLKLILIALC